MCGTLSRASERPPGDQTTLRGDLAWAQYYGKGGRVTVKAGERWIVEAYTSRRSAEATASRNNEAVKALAGGTPAPGMRSIKFMQTHAMLAILATTVAPAYADQTVDRVLANHAMDTFNIALARMHAGPAPSAIRELDGAQQLRRFPVNKR